jgi:hypothetical protein
MSDKIFVSTTQPLKAVPIPWSIRHAWRGHPHQIQENKSVPFFLNTYWMVTVSPSRLAISMMALASSSNHWRSPQGIGSMRLSVRAASLHRRLISSDLGTANGCLVA